MRSKHRLRFAAAAAVAVVVAGALVSTSNGAGAAVPSRPGWTLAWADDFTGPSGSLPNTSNWRFSIGHSYPGGPPNWGTGEIAYHTNNPANVSLDGAGNLRITPLRDGAGNWTSARIETNRENFRPPAGGVVRIESRIQMPNVTGSAALGYWPAFWALGQPYRGNWWNWPGIGEFDIMENVNGINSVWAVLHCGVAPGGPCNEFTGIAANRACPGSSCQSAFHTYSFEWDTSISPNELRWYVDGQQYHRVSQAQLPADTWNQMTTHAGYFIILNVAIGGAFPDAIAGHATPTGATVPGRPMVVDYVAVWTRGGGTTPPPTSSPPPPPPGGGTSYEAEASGNTRSGATRVASCSACSGGQKVGWIGNTSSNWLRFNGVSVPSAGSYTMRVAAAVSGTRTFSVSVNGGAAQTVSFTGSSFGTPITRDVTVSLNAGSNTIRFFNNTAWAPDLDRITILGGSTSPPPPSSPPPAGARDAYAPIQAESFNAQNGVVSYGSYIGNLANGDWARFDNVNFGSTPPRDFIARVASGAPAGVGGLVEVSIDSVSNPIGSFAVSNTGGWTSWQSVPGNVSAVTGTHTVYLRFTSGQPQEYVNVDWFHFRR